MGRSLRSLGVFVLPAIAAFAQDAGEPRTLASLSDDATFAGGAPVESIAAGEERIDRLHHVEIDSVGRIVVSGTFVPDPRAPVSERVPVLARFLPDGSLDPAFGGDGVVALPFVGEPDGLAVDLQDRAVVCGRFRDPAASGDALVFVQAWIVRLREDGTPDPGFSGDGVLEAPAEALLSPTEVRVSPADGSLLALLWDFQSTSLRTIRATTDGVPDADYGQRSSAGAAVLFPRGLEVDAEGGAIVIGEWGSLRFGPDGARDGSFGGSGALVTEDGSAVTPIAVTIDDAGRIVVLDASPALRRYDTRGVLDRSFGSDGRLDVQLAVPGDSWFSGFVTPVRLRGLPGPEGRIVLATTLRRRDWKHQESCLVQVVDPARPGAVESYLRRAPRGLRNEFPDVAVSADGERAYAVGWTERYYERDPRPLLSCVDLTAATPQPPPNVAISWRRPPVAYLAGEGIPALANCLAFRGSLRALRRGGEHYERDVAIWLSDDDRLDASDVLLCRLDPPSFPRGRGRRFPLAPYVFTDAVVPSDLTGKRLIAVHEHAFPETDDADDVSVSPPLRMAGR